MDRLKWRLLIMEKNCLIWLDKHANDCLRISIGIIYVTFGLLKFFPNYSPAEQLAADTICIITFDLITGQSACLFLAVIETGIGIGLLINAMPRAMILLTIWHMCCTFLPLLILPEYTYSTDPFSLSIVGQYIFKNLIIVSALLMMYKNQRLEELRHQAAD